MSATKLFVLNNYPMDRVSREVKLGETPDQGLFGANKLTEYGYEIVFLPYPPTGPWLLIQQLLSLILVLHLMIYTQKVTMYLQIQ